MNRHFVFLSILTLFLGQTILFSQVQPAPFSLGAMANVRDITLSIDGTEAYSTVQSPSSDLSVIVRMRKSEGVWGKPEIAPFSGEHVDLEPFLSPDNLRLYFASSRPRKADTVSVTDFDIWYVSRSSIDSDWGEAVNVGAPVNSPGNEFYPAITKDGSLYFTCDCEGAKGKDDIFFSEFRDGRYSQPVSLPESVNSEGYEFNAYISPDGDLLIYSGYGRPDGSGGGDLYYSLKNNYGDWNPAVNLGSEINSKYLDYCPFYHIESQTLYFTSRRSSLTEYGPFRNIDDLNQSLNTYDNGQSKLYKSKWKPDQ